MTGPGFFGNAVVSGGALARFSPLPKVCFVLGFLVLTVSFDRYDWSGSSLFAVIPFLLAWSGGVSAGGGAAPGGAGASFRSLRGGGEPFF